MLLPRPLKKLLAVFRGGVSPLIIFLSVFLGFWFGLIPGWSGVHTIIIILILILNIHLGLFLLTAGIGKALCFAAAPVLYHVGLIVQNYLSGLLNILASIPIIGMTDFNRFSVAGALLIGPIIGAIAGLILAKSVIKFRQKLLSFEEGSEKFKKWYSNRWVRILDRILIGKRTKDAKSLFTSKAKTIRKAGVGLAVVVLAVSLVTTYLIKNNMIKDYTAGTLTKANGAEVNLENLDLSIIDGSVSVSGIQVTDAENPNNNQVSIDKIGADASMYDLLLGKVVMDNVEVSNVRFDQTRATPGKIVEKEAEEQPRAFDPCDYKIEATDIEKLEKYFKDAKALKEKLQKIRKWLPESKEQAKAKPEEVPQEYLEYLQASAETSATPRILARKILADNVHLPSPVFGNSKILLANISDSPQTAQLPVSLELESYDTAAEIDITFDYLTKGGPPKVCGNFKGIDLGKTQSSFSRNAGLTFESGTASGQFEGQITKEMIDLAVTVTLDNLKAEGQGDGILGLGAQNTSEAFAALTNLTTTIRVVGPVTDPRLVFDVKGLQEELKNALIKAGKEKLSQEIDKQIDEQIEKNLGDKVPSEIKDKIEESKGLLESIGGGLLKDNKDDK